MNLFSFSLITLSVFLSVDVVPSATLADQPVAPPASSSQRQEIALKQVSRSAFISSICRFSEHELTHSVFLSQEQDSPDSLFSFAIDISEEEGEEASSSHTVGITSAEIRAKLKELSALLHQDTAQLVDDSDPAKVLFRTLSGQIPTDFEEILFQAAHLESRQLQYQRASLRLADRAAQTQLSEEMRKEKLLTDEKHKNIGILRSSENTLK